jgi:hypothetical protein
MSKQLTPAQRTAVSRIASLTLANAMIFQEVASAYVKGIDPLRKTMQSPDFISALISHWQYINDNINYVPIFNIAKEILLTLPSNPDIDKALKFLAEKALDIVRNRAALRHDLMGRVYHRLLVEAKFLGTFYTSVPAATLLLKLALAVRSWPETQFNLEQLKSFKIGDLACGTGTLLMAADEAIIDNYVHDCVNNQTQPNLHDLHNVLMESIIYGYDVLASAIHLTASTLALQAPAIAFKVTHLYSLPHAGLHHRLGSIEFLKDREIAMSQDMFGISTSPGQVTAEGNVKQLIAALPDLDLCVMNPPFTRSVGGNLLFGSAPPIERSKMQKDLAKLLKTSQVLASSTAGLGSVFVAIGDRALKENGRIALVLPKALLSGVSWKPTREIFNRRYLLEYLIVSQDPERWNFSENTSLSEVLVIAKKISESPQPNTESKVICVNLWKNPATSFESLNIAHIVTESETPSVKDSQGALEIIIGDNKSGEALTIPWNELKGKLWILPCAFAQSDLIRVAYHLCAGSIWLPGVGTVGKIPLVHLGELGKIGPDRRDIHDGFKLAKGTTNYPAFWGHDAPLVKTLAQSPNRYLSPLAKAKVGRNLRKVEDLWPKAGHILLAERLRCNTQRLVTVRLQSKVLSNVWWPFRLNDDSETSAKALVLWLNSTLGLVLLLTHREETEGAWIDFKKPVLAELPVLAVTNLAPEKSKLRDAYDKLCNDEIMPFPYMATDTTRIKIDEAITQALGLPDISMLREMLAREPVVCLKSIT